MSQHLQEHHTSSDADVGTAALQENSVPWFAGPVL